MKPKTTRRQLILVGLATLIVGDVINSAAHASRPDSFPKFKNKKNSMRKPLVMLDPGHGGIDSGAIGHEGSFEKHVVLEIAKYVQTILILHGVDVRLTRSDDTFIPLNERVKMAHLHQADLFMSIHADGFTSPEAHGASVFALSNRGATSAMAKYFSDSENAADDIAGKKTADKDNYLKKIIFDLEQTETIKESLSLGSHLVNHISSVHHMHSQETEQAAFVVLKSPYIPSILVETSFITNPEEEKLLGTPRFRYRIATALSEGIISYFNELKK
ncbi:N-acetylmuramoyl-L-alanine amidase AmiA [Klebsiella aerogenes]|uniref:N-acetylmuramoyl-L-alanine amidase AmiA n=1 Tax=Klebsiella aerogenes TaxID=548 RepID=UPI001868723D|nr:N-acetylmuramoyl-L-alanine amidase AmiA [Klebsiella aerogenes]